MQVDLCLRRSIRRQQRCRVHDARVIAISAAIIDGVHYTLHIHLMRTFFVDSKQLELDK